MQGGIAIQNNCLRIMAMALLVMMHRQKPFRVSCYDSSNNSSHEYASLAHKKSSKPDSFVGLGLVY